MERHRFPAQPVFDEGQINRALHDLETANTFQRRIGLRRPPLHPAIPSSTVDSIAQLSRTTRFWPIHLGLDHPELNASVLIRRLLWTIALLYAETPPRHLHRSALDRMFLARAGPNYWQLWQARLSALLYCHSIAAQLDQLSVGRALESGDGEHQDEACCPSRWKSCINRTTSSAGEAHQPGSSPQGLGSHNPLAEKAFRSLLEAQGQGFRTTVDCLLLTAGAERLYVANR